MTATSAIEFIAVIINHSCRNMADDTSRQENDLRRSGKIEKNFYKSWEGIYARRGGVSMVRERLVAVGSGECQANRILGGAADSLTTCGWCSHVGGFPIPPAGGRHAAATRPDFALGLLLRFTRPTPARKATLCPAQPNPHRYAACALLSSPAAG